MKGSKTERGFRVYVFMDLNENACSVQESSLATDSAIWLGVDRLRGTPARMHLNREQVNDLLPILQVFAETGELPKVEGEE